MPPNRPYVLALTRRAERELERLAASYNAGRRPQDIRTIEGKPGSSAIDSGEYRILYRVEDDAARIRVWRIGHRKDVYRNL